MSYLLAFLGFTALIILHELGHFMAAKAVGMRVERFSLFFPPLLIRKKIGETEYAIGATPLGGYVKITGMNPEEEVPEDVRPRSYYSQPVWKRIAVILAGPMMNILVAFAIFTGFYMLAVQKLVPEVGGTLKGTPAERALKPGDELVSVDGKRDGVVAFHNQIASHKCAGKPVAGCKAKQPVRLVLLRQGKKVKVNVRPVYQTKDKPHGMRVGFTFKQVHANYSLPKAISSSLATSWRITTGTVDAIARIFDPKKRRQISGVVGTYKVTQESFNFNMAAAFFILGLISLSLALINLFPFLPLDGGHIFFSLAEKVRGRPVSYETMQRASIVGFMIVLMLFVIGLTNDIGRLTGGGFNLR